MRQMCFYVLCLLLALPGQALGQLAVKILEAPQSVYSYEPVFVTFEVRNEGREPLLVPVHGCGGQGTVLEIGLRGEALRDPCQVADAHVAYHAWVLPGERRLFLQAAALGYEGMFEVQAVVRSPGECHGSLVGPVRLPLPPYRESDGNLGYRFDCWSGEAISQTILVNVEVPTSEVDRAAAELLNLPFAGNGIYGLIPKSAQLTQQFPTSHYAYAALFALGASSAMLRAAELQPENPLNRWGVAAAAANLIMRTRECAPPSSEPFFNLEESKRRKEKALSDFPLTKVAREYLDQVQRDVAAEECPGFGSTPERPAPASKSDAPGGAFALDQAESATDEPSSPSSTHPQPTPSAPLLSYPPSKGLGTPNMGFRTRLSLSTGSTERIYWLSLPYRYTPTDVGTPGVVDAEDLCEDFDTPAVLGILRWNEPTSTFVEHTCGSPSPFALVKGTGYGIRIATNYNIDSILSGGHDDAFTFSIPPTSGSQMSWISLPYHLRRTRVNPLPDGFTAEDLCRQIGSAEVRAIVRHDTETGLFHAYVCGSTFQTPFLIQNLQAYGVINKPGQTISWQPEHY